MHGEVLFVLFVPAFAVTKLHSVGPFGVGLMEVVLYTGIGGSSEVP